MEAIVADFGLARTVQDSGKTNSAVGPLKWMAPVS
jgi:serine/threonine protein kinase